MAGIAEGLLNKEIAYRLQLSEQAVKQLSHTAFAKLGVHNRTAAAVKVLRSGMLMPSAQ